MHLSTSHDKLVLLSSRFWPIWSKPREAGSTATSWQSEIDRKQRAFSADLTQLAGVRRIICFTFSSILLSLNTIWE